MIRPMRSDSFSARMTQVYQTHAGFVNRLVICWCAGILLLFVFNIRNYDLHFLWRGHQKVSSSILIANIPNDPAEMREAIELIRVNSPQLIVAPVNRRESSILGEFREIITIPRKGFKPDSDGIIRTLKVPQTLLDKMPTASEFNQKNDLSFINFRGPQGTFDTIFFYELKSQKILPTILRDKIIILNLQDQESEPLATPVGDLPPAEILANMVDNILLNRWISPIPVSITILDILFITAAVAFIVITFTANLAFLGVAILLVTICSLSFFLFDNFYLWLPITTFIIQTLIAYLVFVNYKLTKKEQFAWRLEKETIYRTEMEEMKKNFLNLFSHDLKTPIAKIIGQLEILEGQFGSPDKMKDGFVKIRRYSNELNQYVKNILKISQIESDRFQLKREPCDINLVVSEATQILKPLADEKSISLSAELEPLFSIKCDKELVQQIILNILENAIKYSPSQSRVQVRSTEENDFVVISVSDEGKGIKPEDQDVIWQKFSRLNEQNEGTGLGLYLVKYFVEAHNGAVFIESEVGKGSTIGFKLPVS